jgi:SAM-dependent methyltransferase
MLKTRFLLLKVAALFVLGKCSVFAMKARLDWRLRPEATRLSVGNSFESLSAKSGSAWGVYNGDTEYDLCCLNSGKFVDCIIRDKSTTGQDGYLLDIGCGDFAWGLETARRVNANFGSNLGITIHIFLLRGENGLETEQMRTGSCCIHFINRCKIEELSSCEPLRGIQFDLVVSRWCFRHLADPVGTFEQTYDILLPGTGILLMDGFFFHFEEDSFDHMTRNAYKNNLLYLLKCTNAPFIIANRGDNGGGSIQQRLLEFALRRPDDAPCTIPWRYGNTQPLHRDYDVASWVITSFVRGDSEVPTVLDRLFEDSTYHLFFFGNKTLLDLLCSQDKTFNIPEWGDIEMLDDENFVVRHLTQY